MKNRAEITETRQKRGRATPSDSITAGEPENLTSTFARSSFIISRRKLEIWKTVFNQRFLRENVMSITELFLFLQPLFCFE